MDKTAIIDASSAILLFKAGLHKVLVEIYYIVMPGSVYTEITADSYPGADEYQQLLASDRITLQEPLSDIQNEQSRPGMNNLDKGEYDSIALYYAHLGDFIITDDGAAARYCKREEIPFLNALLIPKILRFSEINDECLCRESIKKIIKIGRYSPEIISFAEKCKRDELFFFMP